MKFLLSIPMSVDYLQSIISEAKQPLSTILKDTKNYFISGEINSEVERCVIFALSTSAIQVTRLQRHGTQKCCTRSKPNDYLQHSSEEEKVWVLHELSE